MSQRFTIFVVDDNEAMGASLAALFSSMNLKSKLYRSAESFLADFQPTWSGCLLLDVRLEGMSGFELGELLAARGIDLPIIMMSGHTTEELLQKAKASRILGLLQKPFSVNELLRYVTMSMAAE